MPKRNLIWLIVAALAALSAFLYFRKVPTRIVREPPRIDPAFAALRATERLAREHYYRDTPTSAPDGALRGFLAALDPYCRYVPAGKHEKLEQAIYGRRAGLGLGCAVENGRVVVVGTTPGSAANRAALRAGDVLLDIDGQPLQDVTLEQVELLLAGRQDGEVTIAVSRRDEPRPWTVHLECQPYSIETVQGLFRGPDELWRYWLDEGRRIAYVRIAEFAALTPEDLQKVLRPLMAESESLEALVLDLRGNPGGPLPQAVSVAEMFLESGLVVMIQRRGRDERYYAHRDRALPPMRLAVLVDAHTASAAELVAGALKERDRAVVIGQATSGKDLVQECFPLGDDLGEVLLTTGRFFFQEEPSPADLASPPGSVVRPHIDLPLDEPVAEKLRQMRWREGLVAGQPAATQPTPQTEESVRITWLIQDAPLRKALELLTDVQAYRATLEEAATTAPSQPAK